MSEHHDETLSRSGEIRRKAMLDDLLDVMAHSRRARRMRRGAVAATGTILVGLLAVWVAAPSARLDYDVPSSPIASSDVRGKSGNGELAQAEAGISGFPRDNVIPDVPASHAVVIRMVRTDPSIVGRYRARSTGRSVQVDDDALLETLAAIHRPAGLIRFGDRVALSAPVTDAQLALDR